MNKAKNLSMILLIASLVGCGGKTSSGSTNNTSSVVASTTQTITSTQVEEMEYVIRLFHVAEKIIFSDYVVNAYKDDVLVASGKTIYNGKAVLKMLPGVYRIEVSNLPEGYYLQDEFYTSASSDTCRVVITSSIIEEEFPEYDGTLPTPYKAEDIMRNFRFLDVETNSEVDLLSCFEGKKGLVINYWAPWCLPCRVEFPAIVEAYELYKDDIAVVALNVDSRYTLENIRDFVDELGLTFTVGQDTHNSSIYAYLNCNYVPTTTIVDRNGMIRSTNSGSMSSVSYWADLFAELADDGYNKY